MIRREPRLLIVGTTHLCGCTSPVGSKWIYSCVPVCSYRLITLIGLTLAATTVKCVTKLIHTPRVQQLFCFDVIRAVIPCRSSSSECPIPEIIPIRSPRQPGWIGLGDVPLRARHRPCASPDLKNQLRIGEALSGYVRAVMDGEHCVRGFTNRDIRTKLQLTQHSRGCGQDRKKASSKVSRIFRRFHASVK